jgi:hypothetical protein
VVDTVCGFCVSPLAVHGRGGERLLARLGMDISDDTILRLLKLPTVAPPAPDVLHVVGIDDWAWQKGPAPGSKIPRDQSRFPDGAGAASTR